MRLPDPDNFSDTMNHAPFRIYAKEPTLENAAACVAAFVEANGGWYPGGNDLYRGIFKVIYEGLVAVTEENERLKKVINKAHDWAMDIAEVAGEARDD